MGWKKPFLIIHTIVGHQVLLQLVPLVFQYLTQIRRYLMGDLIDEAVQLSQIVGQTDQLVQSAHFQVGDVELVVDRQTVLLAGDVVEGLPCLQAGLVSGSRYEPVFRHRAGLHAKTEKRKGRIRGVSRRSGVTVEPNGPNDGAGSASGPSDGRTSAIRRENDGGAGRERAARFILTFEKKKRLESEKFRSIGSDTFWTGTRLNRKRPC